MNFLHIHSPPTCLTNPHIHLFIKSTNQNSVVFWLNQSKFRCFIVDDSSPVFEYGYFMYFSMNFLWNSERSVSFMNALFFLSSSPFAQFLNTTSSSHLQNKQVKLTLFQRNNQNRVHQQLTLIIWDKQTEKLARIIFN